MQSSIILLEQHAISCLLTRNMFFLKLHVLKPTTRNVVLCLSPYLLLSIQNSIYVILPNFDSKLLRLTTDLQIGHGLVTVLIYLDYKDKSIFRHYNVTISAIEKMTDFSPLRKVLASMTIVVYLKLRWPQFFVKQPLGQW